MSLSRESPFCHKVVYSVHDDCPLRQKSIHHEQEITMLFSSISEINGRLFLHCSIVWRQICWTDYRTTCILEELTSENKCIFALTKHRIVYLFPVLDLLIKCLVTKLWTNQNFQKFWSKTEWIGSVQPEKFRKSVPPFEVDLFFWLDRSDRNGPFHLTIPTHSQFQDLAVQYLACTKWREILMTALLLDC